MPHLALSTAIFFALVCVGMLIYFVDHMASRINVDTVIALVSADLRTAFQRRPRPVGRRVPRSRSAVFAVRRLRAGRARRSRRAAGRLRRTRRRYVPSPCSHTQSTSSSPPRAASASRAVWQPSRDTSRSSATMRFAPSPPSRILGIFSHVARSSPRSFSSIAASVSTIGSTQNVRIERDGRPWGGVYGVGSPLESPGFAGAAMPI